MKGYLLDTNCVSELVSIKPEPLVTAWLDQANESSLYLSVLTLGEIRKGIAGLSPNTRRAQLEERLSVDLSAVLPGAFCRSNAAIADRWGTLVESLHSSGSPIGTVDALIAATALNHDLAVATRNTREFGKTGVPLLNPWKAL